MPGVNKPVLGVVMFNEESSVRVLSCKELGLSCSELDFDNPLFADVNSKAALAITKFTTPIKKFKTWSIY